MEALDNIIETCVETLKKENKKLKDDLKFATDTIEQLQSKVEDNEIKKNTITGQEIVLKITSQISSI